MAKPSQQREACEQKDEQYSTQADEQTMFWLETAGARNRLLHIAANDNTLARQESLRPCSQLACAVCPPGEGMVMRTCRH
jgi:hypothetical protein